MDNSLDHRMAIDQLCDEFESLWGKANTPQEIEVFLLRVDPSLRTEVLPLLVELERHYRCQRGETPTLEEYHERFPELRSAGAVACRPDTPTHVPASSAPESPRPESRPKNTTSPPRRIVGQYELKEPLGRGGMGEVHAARHLELNRDVVLKSVSRRGRNQSDLTERLRTEARRLAELKHSGIVEIYDCFLHEEQVWVAMERVDGESLFQQIRKQRPFDAREAARIIRDSARALHYAHERRIIHRDVKPQNIMLDQANQPRLIDFGLAVQVLDAWQPTQGEFGGTFNYMAPEQADPERLSFGAVSDVYGLGATLYDMLMFIPPVIVRESDKPGVVDDLSHRLSDIHDQIRRFPVLSPRLRDPKIPRDLESICLKCLEKSPEDRYQTAADLADDLQRYLDGKPTRARPIGYPQRFVRWCRREPALSSLVTSVALLLSLALALSLFVADQRGTLAEQNQTLADQRGANNQLLLSLAEGDPQQDLALPRDPVGLRWLRQTQQQLDAQLRDRDDPPARATLAMLNLRIGKLSADDEPDVALKALTAAIELYEGLMKADPAEPRYQLFLSDAYTTLGNLQIEQRGHLKDAPTKDAIESYERARNIRRELSEQHPQPIWERKFAGATYNLGQAKSVLGNERRDEELQAAGLKLVREANEQQVALLKLLPEDALLRRDLSFSTDWLSIHVEDLQAAEELHQLALQRFHEADEAFLKLKSIDTRLVYKGINSRSRDSVCTDPLDESVKTIVQASQLLPLDTRLTLLRHLLLAICKECERMAGIPQCRIYDENKVDVCVEVCPPIAGTLTLPRAERDAAILRSWNGCQNLLAGIRQAGDASAIGGEAAYELAECAFLFGQSIEEIVRVNQSIGEIPVKDLLDSVRQLYLEAQTEVQKCRQQNWKPKVLERLEQDLQEAIRGLSVAPTEPVKT